MPTCRRCHQELRESEGLCAACGTPRKLGRQPLQSLREACFAITLILFLATWTLGLLLRPLPRSLWALLLGIAILSGLVAAALTFQAERRLLTLRHHWLIPAGVVAWILSIMSAVILFASG